MSPTPRSSKTYHVFLASPGDMETERRAVRDFFDDYNHTQAEPRGLRFEVLDWESYASAGIGRPQALITKQTLSKYRDSLALVIGLLGQRFGTPSGTHESGTEEEFEVALVLRRQNDGWPEIKWFLREQPNPEYAPKTAAEMRAAAEQMEKVEAFRQRLQTAGPAQSLYATFEQTKDFRRVLRDDLTRWLNDPKRPWNWDAAASATGAQPAQSKPQADPSAIRSHLRAYQAALAADCRNLPLQLLDAGEGERKGRFGLPQVFVPLDVARPPERLEQETEDLEARYRDLVRGAGKDRKRTDEALEQFSVAVLIGDPGSGKSALVNHLTWRLLEKSDDDPAPAALSGLAPIRIILRRVEIPADAKEPKTEWLWQALEADVRDRLALSLPEPDVPAAAEAVERALRERWKSDEQGCLLLLDGLDEVPETGRRRENLIEAVKLLIDSRSDRDRVLITARPYAYAQPRWQLPGIPALVLAPFDADQRAAFWRRWYGAARLDLNLTAKAAETEARRLASLVDDLDHVRDLAERPLLATMLVLVYQRGNRLPPGRVELYAESLDLLVSRWRSGESAFRDCRGNRVTLPDQDLKNCLAALALAGHSAQRDGDARDGTADLTEEQVLAAFRPLLKQLGSDDLLSFLRRHTGILVAREEGRFSFPHRSFQEYLAMLGLKALGTRGHLIPKVRDDPLWWREVFLLAVAEKRTDRDVGLMLMDWLLRGSEALQKDNRRRLSVLAGLGLLELELDVGATGYDEERDAIRQALVNLIEDPDALNPTERAEAGRVLGWIGDSRPGVGLSADGLPDIAWCEVPCEEFDAGPCGYEIARYPITNAQYRAFIDDGGYESNEWWERLAERIEGPYEPSWSEPNHPRESVSWYEAVAFCRWLSAKVEEEIRLPTEAEWERVARGTDEREYPWGDGYRAGYANIIETNVDVGPGYLERTTAVGIYPHDQSPYRTRDMAGNVREWCLNPCEDPDSSATEGAAARALRGGSWYDTVDYARTVHSVGFDPMLWNFGVGFRLFRQSPVLNK